MDSLLDGIAHWRAGRLEAARDIFDAFPDDPQALYLLGLSHVADAPARAIPPLRVANRLLPEHLGVALNLARVLVAAGPPAEAIAAARALTHRTPGMAEAWLLLGTALNADRQSRDAATALRRAVALDPVSAPAHLNLGNALADLDDMDAAADAIRAALAIDPTLVEAETSLGFVLAALGRPLEAIEACRRAIALRPDYARAHWNEGVAHLLAGDWAAGWDKYEWRKRHEEYGSSFRTLGTPEWQGDVLDGRSLLVLAEQGLGDTIMLARYLPSISACGGRVVLACDRALHTLLAPLVVRVTDRSASPPPHDFWIDQMSLPRLFATRPETVPAPHGYLARPRQPPGSRDLARGGDPRPRIGLVWAGNPAHHNDGRRSMPAAALGPLLARTELSFVALQHGPAATDVPEAELPRVACADFAETARILAGLDLLISVDTSVAHLAGALCVPCWTLLPHAPDWRWMLGCDDTPWYRSMRLFRQTTPGDWRSVVAAVGLALDQRFGVAGRAEFGKRETAPA